MTTEEINTQLNTHWSNYQTAHAAWIADKTNKTNGDDARYALIEIRKLIREYRKSVRSENDAAL
jgi:hypothetical protein